mmetsp:Transcript_17701/g.49006  ORF Transcript_17701/g.49006 Transcript_17701/m.49006 type:complete len:95 (+) Transcript_17701:2648-2932(+)
MPNEQASRRNRAPKYEDDDEVDSAAAAEAPSVDSTAATAVSVFVVDDDEEEEECRIRGIFVAGTRQWNDRQGVLLKDRSGDWLRVQERIGRIPE